MVRKASSGADQGHGDRVVRFFERQEQTVCSKIGAGLPLGDALRRSRWSREASVDFDCDIGVAGAMVDMIADRIEDAIHSIEDSREKISAIHIVYAHYVEATRGSENIGEVSGGDHMVYKLFDSSNNLLYIGITSRGPVRLVEHYKFKPWFNEVSRVEFERYETRYDSQMREKYLIETRSPLHNVQHNQGRQIAQG